MKVRAKHWLKVDGVWRKAGEEFEISTQDADVIDGLIEIAETPVPHTEAAPEQKPESEIVKRRGRPKRAEQPD